jgi:hypothetical protein
VPTPVSAPPLTALLTTLALTALALGGLRLAAAACWWLFVRLIDPLLERSRAELQHEQILRRLALQEERRRRLAREQQRLREGRKVHDLEGKPLLLSPEDLPAFRRLCWQELELPAGSSWAVVRRQWRRRSLRWHPDQGGETSAWLRKQRAYEALRILRDPTPRSAVASLASLPAVLTTAHRWRRRSSGRWWRR